MIGCERSNYVRDVGETESVHLRLTTVMNKRERGFTIAELLIVIAIVAITISMAVPSFKVLIQILSIFKLESVKGIIKNNIISLPSFVIYYRNDGSIRNQDNEILITNRSYDIGKDYLYQIPSRFKP